MATRNLTKTSIGRSSYMTEWSGLTNGDDGEPSNLFGAADRSVQVTGTFGVGGSLRIEGSNDGTNYAVLTDPQGNDLDIIEAKIEAVTENVRYIRPRVTAGDGTTSLAVHILMKE